MLRSMTAYGRATLTTPLGRFIAEIQSLNRKFLELNLVLPKELTRFDPEIRRILSTSIYRGAITLKVFAYFEQNSPLVVTPNIPLARQLKEAWGEIAKELELDEKQPLTLELLSQETGIMLYGEELEDESFYRTILLDVVQQALSSFTEMREREGATLQRDLKARFDNLNDWIQQIKQRAGSATTKYREKLKERIEEVLQGAVENEERILREVAIFADRIDITEEITRFQSHINQCENIIQTAEGGVGKTLEFLIQELNREVNTVGSKSSDVEISRLVIDIKSELERIREQVQNIE